MFVLMSSVLVTKTCSDLRLAHPCIITFEKKKGTAVIHRHLKKLPYLSGLYVTPENELPL